MGNSGEEKCLEMTMLQMENKEKDDKIKLIEIDAFEASQLFEEKTNYLTKVDNEMMLLKEKSNQVETDLQLQIRTLQEELKKMESDSLIQSDKLTEKIDYLNLGLEKAIDCVAGKEKMIMSIEATKEQLRSQLHEQVGIINSLKMKYDELVTSKEQE